MNLFGSECFSSLSSDEDMLIRKLLLMHDPDGHCFDSELLLRAVENIMCYSTMPDVHGFHIDVPRKNYACNIEINGSQLGQIISKVSYEMLCRYTGERNLHGRTMNLFDLLGNYRWDDKMSLVLLAFAASYGKIWLIVQLYPQNPLAVSVAKLKQLPSNLTILKPRFKALTLLVKTMVDVTKCIIKFEGLPFRHVNLDDEVMAVTKSYIYIAAYWVMRSSLACSSLITDLIAMKPDQVYSSSSTAIAAWELSSMMFKLNSICSCLRRQVDLCHQEIETKMYHKLSSSFQEAHANNNQEALCMLLVSKDDLPLKNNWTQAKLGVSELKDKVVVLLVSRPELLPLERLLLLLHQMHHKKLEESYELVWLPISSSDTWTDSEVEIFKFLSNSLPWHSVWGPWTLNSAVVNYIKQAWNFDGDPIMVVLDSQGTVTNSNAIDMVLIWGARALPFSSALEKELWKEQNWSLQLLVNEIDPLLTTMVGEGRNICIYGSDSLDWIRQFNASWKEIRKNGVEVEMVYVGHRNLGEHVRRILAIINQEMHRNLLSFTKLHFFWLRLESIRKLKLQQEQTIDYNHVLQEVSTLLDVDNEGWALIGRGSTTNILKLQGNKAMECLNKFHEWGKNVTRPGFLDALRAALEPPPPALLAGPCNYTSAVPYNEGLLEGVAICQKCNRPLKKFVIYE